MFQGRALLVATQHAKEKVMAPLLQEALGVFCEVRSDFNTDQFGTFTGEVARVASPLDTLRAKCYAAMDRYLVDLAVASEGSFGPHPSLYFIPADDEFVMLADRKNKLEIFARELSTETNFGQTEVTRWDELKAFAIEHKFPTHALILKNAPENFTTVVKGITQWDRLEMVFSEFRQKQTRVFVETDMRACFNPTRMNVIEEATKKLIKKILSVCPQCQMPGFDAVELISGLPCSWCGSPTRSVLSVIYQCTHCQYRSEKKYPNEKTVEDPAACDRCNP
jgi:hypothetical protein